MATIEIIASHVIFRSALVGRKSGINSSPCSRLCRQNRCREKFPSNWQKAQTEKSSPPMEKSSRLFAIFHHLLHQSQHILIMVSKILDSRGTKRISRVAAIAKIARIIVTSHAVKSELVKGIPKMLPMCSGIREM